MSSEARATELQRIDGELMSLERQEEVLLRELDNTGTSMLRRCRAASPHR
jgi:hypothetical protein